MYVVKESKLIMNSLHFCFIDYINPGPFLPFKF